MSDDVKPYTREELDRLEERIRTQNTVSGSKWLKPGQFDQLLATARAGVEPRMYTRHRSRCACTCPVVAFAVSKSSGQRPSPEEK